MSGLTYVITGANRGIGKGLLETLILRPQTTAVAAVRNVESSKKTLSSIPIGTGSKILVVKLDCTSATDATDAPKNSSQSTASPKSMCWFPTPDS